MPLYAEVGLRGIETQMTKSAREPIKPEPTGQRSAVIGGHETRLYSPGESIREGKETAQYVDDRNSRHETETLLASVILLSCQKMEMLSFPTKRLDRNKHADHQQGCQHDGIGGLLAPGLTDP